MRKLHILAILLAFFAVPAVGTMPTALDGQVRYMAKVLKGKQIRHHEIRDYLTPMFQDVDGRDRFLLNAVALARRGGILDTTIRRTAWKSNEIDEVYGYAAGDLTLCGRWYLWIPRCVDIETKWRRVDGAWFLLPPDKIRLDPDVKKFLRRS